MAMLDGILYAIKNNKTEDELLAEVSKEYGEESDYLEKYRKYRAEEDVFEDFTEEERNKFFGKAPATIYENINALDKYPEKVEVLKRNGVLTEQLINSFRMATIKRWKMEIAHRIVNKFTTEIRSCKCLHDSNKALDLDLTNWMKIHDLRLYIMKDTNSTHSLFTRLKNAINEDNLQLASDLYLELESKMSLLRNMYSSYKKNLLDI